MSSPLRTPIGSHWSHYALAAALVVLGLLTQVRIHLPSRPVEPIQKIHSLRERKDLNVLFVLIDTLRADHLGSYGYARATSPTIDELARFGVRFARARAQSSWTKASLASIWLAKYPSSTGVLRFSHGIGDEARMPAEVFRDAGYRTGGIYRNGWVAANFGFAQGFEMYLRPVPRQAGTDGFERASRSLGFEVPGTDLDATEAAIEFLRNTARQPFFLYVHYMDVHQYLYEEHHATFGTRYIDAYDNAIRWTDTNVAMLVSELDALGLFDDTIVVIASDHGEAFGEHGREGHAQDLHAEVIDVPLIVSLPFRLEEPVVVQSVVRNIDIFPTVFDLLGLPAQQGTEGRSLLPLIGAAGTGRPEDGLGPGEAIAHLDQTWGRIGAEAKPLVGYEQDGLRILYSAGRPDRIELYDKQADPGEQNDIAGQHPQPTAALGRRARDYLAREVCSDLLDVEVDEMQRNQLRALGYLLESVDREPAANTRENAAVDRRETPTRPGSPVASPRAAPAP